MIRLVTRGRLTQDYAKGLAAGTVSHVSTARAWTGAEFKAVAERAAKAAKAYRPPGKRK